MCAAGRSHVCEPTTRCLWRDSVTCVYVCSDSCIRAWYRSVSATWCISICAWVPWLMYMSVWEVCVWENESVWEVHVWERGMRYDTCLCDIVLWLLHMSLWLCAVAGSYKCDRWTDHRVSVVRLIHMSACVPWLIHMCECEVHEPLCVCDMTHSYVCMCAVTHSHVCVGGRLTNWRLCHDAFIRVHVCRDSLIYVRERYTDQFVFVKWHIHMWARVLWLNYICEWEVHRQFWMCDMTHSSKCVRLTCPLPHSPALALTTTIFRIYIYRNHSRQNISTGFARPVMQVCT